MLNKEITYTLSFGEVIEILRLVRESAGCAEMRFRIGELTLDVTKSGSGLPPSNEPAREGAPQKPAGPKGIERLQPRDGLVSVTAPVLGTFYRAPAPGAAPFVGAGDTVRASDAIGLIEVMKLFTTVTAGTDGRVVEILAEDAALVEYGEPLALIDPS